jgi:hypothetical protein
VGVTLDGQQDNMVTYLLGPNKVLAFCFFSHCLKGWLLDGRPVKNFDSIFLRGNATLFAFELMKEASSEEASSEDDESMKDDSSKAKDDKFSSEKASPEDTQPNHWFALVFILTFTGTSPTKSKLLPQRTRKNLFYAFGEKIAPW